MEFDAAMVNLLGTFKPDRQTLESARPLIGRLMYYSQMFWRHGLINMDLELELFAENDPILLRYVQPVTDGVMEDYLDTVFALSLALDDLTAADKFRHFLAWFVASGIANYKAPLLLSQQLSVFTNMSQSDLMDTGRASMPPEYFRDSLSLSTEDVPGDSLIATVSFQDIPRFDADSIKRIIAGTPREILLFALTGAPEKIQTVIYDVMTRRTEGRFREELTTFSVLRSSKMILAARATITQSLNYWLSVKLIKFKKMA